MSCFSCTNDISLGSTDAPFALTRLLTVALAVVAVSAAVNVVEEAAAAATVVEVAATATAAVAAAVTVRYKDQVTFRCRR